MTKPQWKDAPDWAGCLALDGYGWWWYEYEPIFYDDVWVCSENGGRVELAKIFKEFLEKRPAK